MAKSRSYAGPVIAVLIAAAVVAAGWYYFRRGAEKAPEFTTTKVSRGDITQAVTATGDLQPVVTVDVGAQVSGQVKEVLVDFNSRVKAGQVLARIDPSIAEQKLRQAQADLESARANNQLLKINAERIRELSKKNLVSQSELDTAEAQLAQSNAALMTRTAAVENAKLDLQHCTITAPIDGMVLSRNTDRGRTVNANMNAPVLFTLVNDLTRMQINAAVAEADVGAITEGQDVTFTVDAFPNRTFRGSVRQVRNAATTNQSVVSYATIIDVSNDDLKLKPGMTANVSIVLSERDNVLRVSNSALRARIPAELLPKAPESKDSAAAGKAKTTAPAMTEQDRRTAMRSILADAGVQFGSPASPQQIERVKTLARERGFTDEDISRLTSRLSGGGPGGGRREGGDRGSASTVSTRTAYKLASPDSKQILPVTVKLGITDGVNTEVLEGLEENDTVITAVTIPGANPQPSAQNPFQPSPRFGPPGMGGGGRGR